MISPKRKVAAKKTVKKQVRTVAKKPVRKKQNSVKKMITDVLCLKYGAKTPSVVFFEKNQSGDVPNFIQKSISSDSVQNVAVSSVGANAININIIDHPLDQYSSPYVLDLSAERYIERVKPVVSNESAVSYQDLPAGEILEKLGVFQFLSFENSEILNWCRRCWQRLVGFFQPIDLAPKLPAVKRKTNYPFLDLLQDVALINLIIFLVNGLVKSVLAAQNVLINIRLNLADFFRQDEVVAFKSRVIADSRNDSEERLVGQPAKTRQLPIQEEYTIEQIIADYVAPLDRQISPKNSYQPKKPALKLAFNWPKWSFPRIDFLIWQWNMASLKPVLAFCVVALLITLPIRGYFYYQGAQETKGRVLGQAEQALANLALAQGALTDFKFDEANSHLTNANRDFISAQKQLSEIKSFLTVLAETLPVNNTYRSGKNLLELGEKMTKAGEYLVSGLNQLATTDNEFSLASRAKNFKADIDSALVELESAQENMAKIKVSNLPEENQETFAKLKENLPTFVSSLRESEEMVDFVINFLGDKSLKRYLLVFQNDNELRATGGFMGSFALADFKNGDLAGVKIPGGGTYDVRAGLQGLLKAPQPLQIINARWEFQDSNWWPNWPTSAENITYFYNKSGGATIDGVIAINSDWLGALLGVVGPIEMPKYNKTIAASNFELELQKSVEVEQEDKKQPKKILGDLAPKLIEKIFAISPDKIAELITALNHGLKEKDILISLSNENSQKFVAKNNWDGRFKDPEKDYLNVVATNIGGGKTDGVINQNILHKASIADDGSVTDTLVINRDSFGPTDNQFTNVVNRSYLRVYVPLGSELIKAEGFSVPPAKDFQKIDDYLEDDPKLYNESVALIDQDSQTKIYAENNKTVFGNWVYLKPGEAKDVLLVYKLPFKIDLNKKTIQQTGLLGKVKMALAPEYSYDSYSLLVQKQSGSDNGRFVSTVEYPDQIKPSLVYPSSKVANENGQSVYSDQLSGDLFYFVGLNY